MKFHKIHSLIFFLPLVWLVCVFIFPSTVSAQVTIPPSNFYTGWINAMGLNGNLTTPTGIINAALPLVMVFAGLILFGMLIIGGYQMLMSAGNPKSADAGKQRITMALVGFLVIFASYWLTQIIQIIFGVNILNP